MRWSLILSTFIAIQSALSFVCVALVVPPAWGELQRRGIAAKASSKTYRKNAEQSSYAYKFREGRRVAREKLEREDQQCKGMELMLRPHTDANHVLELQMLNSHLKANSLNWGQLGGGLQNQIRKIINGPGNMAAIPASVNRGKGQLIRHALKGKAITPKEDRDEYTRLSYPTATKNADRIDKALRAAGHTIVGKTFHEKPTKILEVILKATLKVIPKVIPKVVLKVTLKVTLKVIPKVVLEVIVIWCFQGWFGQGGSAAFSSSRWERKQESADGNQES